MILSRGVRPAHSMRLLLLLLHMRPRTLSPTHQCLSQCPRSTPWTGCCAACPAQPAQPGLGEGEGGRDRGYRLVAGLDCLQQPQCCQSSVLSIWVQTDGLPTRALASVDADGCWVNPNSQGLP
jgi:hypothetical protein